MTKETTIYLIRHGQTEYNRMGLLQGRGIDAPLDDVGLEQSHAVARYLKREGVDLIVSSSLERARNTASIIARECSLRVAGCFEDLDEMHFGTAEGRDFNEVSDELQSLYNRWQNGDLNLAFEMGESPRQVLDRANQRLMQVIRENQGNRIVFVIHGRLIRIVLADWLGIGLHRMHEIQHANTSVNKLVWNGSGFRAVQPNLVEHLKDVHKPAYAAS